jgi:hypothetical protein
MAFAKAWRRKPHGLVVHEQCKQENDRQRDAEQPKQCTFTEAHENLLC